MAQPTRNEVCHALAQSMREFGYSDVTDAMAGEIVTAYVAKDPLPHGIVGMFLKRQLDDLREAGVDLSLLA